MVSPDCCFEGFHGYLLGSRLSVFQDYKKTLDVACEQHRDHTYGWVNWTVSEETPDLVFYQSFYGYGMGWKIHVLDEGEEPSSVNRNYEPNHFMVTFVCILLWTYFFPTH